jgi:hypothetical protein
MRRVSVLRFPAFRPRVLNGVDFASVGTTFETPFRRSTLDAGDLDSASPS